MSEISHTILSSSTDSESSQSASWSCSSTFFTHVHLIPPQHVRTPDKTRSRPNPKLPPPSVYICIYIYLPTSTNILIIPWKPPPWRTRLDCKSTLKLSRPARLLWMLSLSSYSIQPLLSQPRRCNLQDALIASKFSSLIPRILFVRLFHFLITRI